MCIKIKNQLMKPQKRTGAKLKCTVATFAAMCIVCMLFFTAPGCGKKNTFVENDDADFCACHNVDDIGKTIPIMNELLSHSPYTRYIENVIDWLREQPCVYDARLIYQNNREYINNETGMTEVALSFEENGITRIFILEFSGNKTNSDETNLKVEGYYEYLYECNLCMDFEIEKPRGSIPAINKFLSGLQNELNNEKKMKALEKWLNIQPCVFRAKIEHYSAVKTDTPTGEIHINFMDNGINRFYVMDVTWTYPMTVTGFHDIFFIHENFEEPVLVPSIKYSLEETTCQIKYTYNDCRGPELIMINCNEALEKYLKCTGEDNVYPPIDFTKYTLLLIYGSECHSITEPSIYLNRYTTGYVLNVDFYPRLNSVVTRWHAEIVVDKLDEESYIEIKKNRLTN